ncbi:MAG: hypothetical protein GXO42_00655 [bacterium]|nr:hypothetical protein [bacterium]
MPVNRSLCEKLAKILAEAALKREDNEVELCNLGYLDRLAHAPAKHVALYYLYEALRDYAAKIRKEGKSIVELREEDTRLLDELAAADPKEMRQLLAYIAAKALMYAMREVK